MIDCDNDWNLPVWEPTCSLALIHYPGICHNVEQLSKHWMQWSTLGLIQGESDPHPSTCGESIVIPKESRGSICGHMLVWLHQRD